MKRTALVTRPPLRRSKPLRGRRQRGRLASPAERAWKAPVGGVCGCGCGRWAPRLHRHHILLAQTVRRAGADEWSLRNAMLVHPDCHAAHHSGFRKLRIEVVPSTAIAYAVDVLGEARATDYFRRRYDCTVGT